MEICIDDVANQYKSEFIDINRIPVVTNDGELFFHWIYWDKFFKLLKEPYRLSPICKYLRREIDFNEDFSKDDRAFEMVTI